MDRVSAQVSALGSGVQRSHLPWTHLHGPRSEPALSRDYSTGKWDLGGADRPSLQAEPGSGCFLPFP